MAQTALRWTLMYPEVSAAIPGARNANQVEDNIRAAELAALSDETMQRVSDVYDRHIRAAVHGRW
jgi:aryl-alcohol dehydrogenase-like predicted oxidoreductase